MGQRGYFIPYSNNNIKLWSDLWLFNWGVDNYQQQHILLKNFINYIKQINYFYQVIPNTRKWVKGTHSLKFLSRRKFFLFYVPPRNLWYIWTIHIFHYQTWIIIIVILYPKREYYLKPSPTSLPINLYLYIKYLGERNYYI